MKTNTHTLGMIERKLRNRLARHARNRRGQTRKGHRTWPGRTWVLLVIDCIESGHRYAARSLVNEKPCRFCGVTYYADRRYG